MSQAAPAGANSIEPVDVLIIAAADAEDEAVRLVVDAELVPSIIRCPDARGIAPPIRGILCS